MDHDANVEFSSVGPVLLFGDFSEVRSPPQCHGWFLV